MIDPEELKRFTEECILLRKAIQEGQRPTLLDYRILRSHISMLLSDLENNYGIPYSSYERPEHPKS
jgi:hypothetical protein